MNRVPFVLLAELSLLLAVVALAAQITVDAEDEPPAGQAEGDVVEDRGGEGGTTSTSQPDEEEVVQDGLVIAEKPLLLCSLSAERDNAAILSDAAIDDAVEQIGEKAEALTAVGSEAVIVLVFTNGPDIGQAAEHSEQVAAGLRGDERFQEAFGRSQSKGFKGSGGAIGDVAAHIYYSPPRGVAGPFIAHDPSCPLDYTQGYQLDGDN